jgi:dTDP-4-dehydrorhamnose 3,5-epimerase-like enzyme
MNSVGDIRLTTLRKFLDPQGFLVAYDGAADFRIDLRRVFVVSGHGGTVRGKHAHKELTQILVCLAGSCRVTCDDGDARREVLLDRPELALQIPPGIWAEQRYIDPESVLMVLCDLPFDESDYIRDYSEFIAFRARPRK